MNSSRTFRFHRFSEIPLSTDTSMEISKYFINTMNNNTLAHNFYNIKEERKDKDNKNQPNFSLTTNQFYKNELSNKDFPLQEIINSDFGKIIKSKTGISKIRNYFSQMTYQNLDNSLNKTFKKNPNFILLLKHYQHMLQYLSDTEKNMNNFNDLLKQTEKEIIIEKEQYIDKELKINKTIEENDNKIFNLENKINIYKKIILAATSTKLNKPLIYTVLDIHDNENNYYCDLCANKIFKSYQEVQNHYIIEHLNVLKRREKNYKYLNDISVNNINYENFYFDTKLNSMKNEIKYLLLEMNSKKDKGYDYNRIKKENFMHNNNTKNLSNKELNFKNIEDEDYKKNEINLDYYENKLNNFEIIQKKYNDNLQKNFDTFKNEIFALLRDLKNNKNIAINNLTYNNNIINNNNKEININKDIDIKKHEFNNNDIKEININKDYNKNENNNYKDNEVFKGFGENYDFSSLPNSYNEKNNKEMFKNNIKKENNITIINDNKDKDEDNNNDNYINQYNQNKEDNNNNLRQNNNYLNNLEINKFANIFSNRENTVLFDKKNDNIKEVNKNYDILKKQNNNYIQNKTKQMINETENKYDLKEDNIKTKEQYKQIINDILKDNEDLTNKIHHNYFDNLLSKMDLKKYLDNID